MNPIRTTRHPRLRTVLIGAGATLALVEGSTAAYAVTTPLRRRYAGAARLPRTSTTAGACGCLVGVP